MSVYDELLGDYSEEIARWRGRGLGGFSHYDYCSEAEPDRLQRKLDALAVLAPPIGAAIAGDIDDLRTQLAVAETNARDRAAEFEIAQDFGRYVAGRYTSLQEVNGHRSASLFAAEQVLLSIVEAKPGTSMRALAQSYFPEEDEP